MTDTDTTAVAVKPTKAEPEWHFIRVSHPVSNKRIVFRSSSEKRAREWLMKRCPRGEEFYYQGPDGHTESYVHNRLHPDNGREVDEWAAFNPEDYVPPEQQLPPGDAGWPDVEG